MCIGVCFCVPCDEWFEKQKDSSDQKILFHFQLLSFSSDGNKQSINICVFLLHWSVIFFSCIASGAQ